MDPASGLGYAPGFRDGSRRTSGCGQLQVVTMKKLDRVDAELLQAVTGQHVVEFLQNLLIFLFKSLSGFYIIHFCYDNIITRR
jgi:hypothetical protein